MVELAGLRLAVVGAGVFGLCVALRAAVAGARVEVWDPAELGHNASGVAGGMIAPVGEALFDDIGDEAFDLFCAGREGWRALERLVPTLSIDRSGAVFRLSNDAFGDRVRRLIADGALIERPSPTDATHGDVRLFSTGDWRIDPRAGLAALKAAILAAGGVFQPKAMTTPDFAAFDAVVIAAGIASRAFAVTAPELEHLQPIKGQLARFQGAGADGPILRSKDIYVVPQPGGALAGATMEPGRDDLTVDAAAIAALRGRAVGLSPELKEAPFEGLAGVRAATPDNLPMAGPSSRPGLYLATGARRNGWLLAPLVSEIVLAYLCGRDPGPFAAALDPRRFSRA